MNTLPEAVSLFLILALLFIVAAPILIAVCMLGRCVERGIINRTDELQDD